MEQPETTRRFLSVIGRLRGRWAIPAEYVDAMAPTTGWAGSEDELAAVLRKFEQVGTDEIQLIPTSSDLDQLRRAADVVGRL